MNTACKDGASTQLCTPQCAQSGASSWLRRYILKRCHPAALFAEVAGFHWFFYFIWQNLWVEAVTSLVLARLLSAAIAWNVCPETMATTFLGKIGLLHLEPFNYLMQFTGFVVLIAGTWSHEAKMIMVGTSMVFLGHICGWGKVAPEFKVS
jgi:hypothetical protein